MFMPIKRASGIVGSLTFGRTIGRTRITHRHEPDSAHIAYRAGLAFRPLAATARVLASRLS